jgi:hypothetical protein
VSSRLYSTNGAYQEPEIYLSLCLRWGPKNLLMKSKYK